MPARLALLLPHRPVRQVQLDPEKTYLLGRGAECDVCLDDSRLSRRHAELAYRDAAWVIRDLESKNGLLVDGRRTRETALEATAWLSLGGVIGRYEELSQAALDAERGAALERWVTTREMSRQLDPRLSLDRLLGRVLESVLSLTHLERGFVLLPDEAGELRISLQRGLNERVLRDEDFNGSWGAVRLALEKRGVVVSSDVSESAGLADRPSIVSGGIRALACVPLETAGHLTGLVYTDSTRNAREFTGLDAELLESLCGQAAIALGVAQVRRRLGSLQGRLEEALDDPERLARLLRRQLPAYRSPADEGELARTALGGSRS